MVQAVPQTLCGITMVQAVPQTLCSVTMVQAVPQTLCGNHGSSSTTNSL